MLDLIEHVIPDTECGKQWTKYVIPSTEKWPIDGPVSNVYIT